MDQRDDGGIWLLDLPPSRRQARFAAALALVAIGGFLFVLRYANTPLARLNVLFPSLDAFVFVTDLVTAVLLLAQFSVFRSRALAALACGYLFTALIVVPHALTFAGAFSPTGLLGANIQTGSWLFIFWHFGFALGLLGYAVLRAESLAEPVVQTSVMPTVIGIVVCLVALVCILTWLATAGATLLPKIILDSANISPIVRYPIGFIILVSLCALVSLALLSKKSPLDHWLMLVALVLIGELVLSGLIATVRFSLGFYVARAFSVVTSSIVLIVLLVETTWLYSRAARSNAILRREQNSRLMNLEALASAITHEVRQPLTAISTFGQAALTFLKRQPPDIDEAAATVSDMIDSTSRADQIFKNIRALFGRQKPELAEIDINELTLETLKALRFDLARSAIETEFELAADLPLVQGSKGQLQEVIINLVQNAIEAMERERERRFVKIRTGLGKSGTVNLSVEDCGPGLAEQSSRKVFDAFVTSKPQGLGLGLAICRLIVERHGGSIVARASGRRGAIFEVMLPAAK